MSTWLVSRAELTNDQVRAIELSPNEHRVIFGAPGSGKTQILIHRARHLADSFRVKPGRFHIFVYTNALRDYIRSALDLVDIPLDAVSTLDAWCKGYYQRNIGAKTPWNATSKQPDFDAIRAAVLEHVRRACPDSERLDFALVDEGQDLDSDAFGILKAVAKHITVCLDHKQQIYDRGSTEDAVLQRLGLKRRNVALLETFRCNPFIAGVSSQYVPDATERGEYARQTRMPQTERETPLLYYAADFDDERHRLLDIVRVRLAKGEHIAILVPLRRQAFGFAKALREAGIEAQDPKTLDFSKEAVKVMPFHSAKGLTFDTVLLPRLVPNSFPKISPARLERLLFVAVSRATRWVFLSTCIGSELPELERLRALEPAGLTVQVGGLFSVMKDERSSVEPEKDSEDDLLDLL